MSAYPKIDAQIAEYQRTHNGRHCADMYRPWMCDRDCAECFRTERALEIIKWLRAGAEAGAPPWWVEAGCPNRIDEISRMLADAIERGFTDAALVARKAGR